MLISELIAKLQKTQTKHGDVEVVLASPDDQDDQRYDFGVMSNKDKACVPHVTLMPSVYVNIGKETE